MKHSRFRPPEPCPPHPLPEAQPAAGHAPQVPASSQQPAEQQPTPQAMLVSPPSPQAATVPSSHPTPSTSPPQPESPASQIRSTHTHSSSSTGHTNPPPSHTRASSSAASTPSVLRPENKASCSAHSAAAAR